MDYRARNSCNLISEDFHQDEIAKIDRYEVYVQLIWLLLRVKKLRLWIIGSFIYKNTRVMRLEPHYQFQFNVIKISQTVCSFFHD